MPRVGRFNYAEGARASPGALRCSRTVAVRDGRRPMPSRLRPGGPREDFYQRSEEHTSELQSQSNLVCRLLLEKKKRTKSLVRGPVEILLSAVRRDEIGAGH